MSVPHYTPSNSRDRRCLNCYRWRSDHQEDGRCYVSRAGLYGPENPMVRWMLEHAPKEAEAPAQTIAEVEP